MDFYSWHSYANVKYTLKCALHCRQLLDKYGFNDVPDILNEWNTCHDPKRRSSDYAAAQVFGMMLTIQTKATTWMLNYYDARCATSQYGGMFSPETWEPFLAYFAFKLFNDAYELKNQAKAESDDGNVAVCAASNGTKKVLLAANLCDQPVDAEFELIGANADDAEVIMTNCEYKNTLTGKKVVDGKLLIPAYTCLELRF